MRLVLSSIVLAALAANPCFAKDGHAQHGARASLSNGDASGKGAISPGGANPRPSTANVPIDAGETVAPPVLPPRGVMQQSNQNMNPTVKIVMPGNPAHIRQSGASASIMRNAIGQPIIASKNFVGGQPHLSPLQNASTVAPPILHGAPAAAPPVVLSGAARVNLANRGSVNGAAVIRPTATPPAIGGPARPHYGINGTTVQSRR